MKKPKAKHSQKVKIASKEKPQEPPQPQAAEIQEPPQPQAAEIQEPPPEIDENKFSKICPNCDAEVTGTTQESIDNLTICPACGKSMLERQVET